MNKQDYILELIDAGICTKTKVSESEKDSPYVFKEAEYNNGKTEYFTTNMRNQIYPILK